MEVMEWEIIRVKRRDDAYRVFTDGKTIVIFDNHFNPLWKVILFDDGSYTIVPFIQAHGGAMYIARSQLKKILETIKKVRNGEI